MKFFRTKIGKFIMVAGIVGGAIVFWEKFAPKKIQRKVKNLGS